MSDIAKIKDRIASLPRVPVLFEPEEEEEYDGFTPEEAVRACEAVAARDTLIADLLILASKWRSVVAATEPVSVPRMAGMTVIDECLFCRAGGYSGERGWHEKNCAWIEATSEES